MKRFNLIISTGRRMENEAIAEIWFLLREIGDEDPNVYKTKVSGLIVAKTSINPVDAIRKLRNFLKIQPSEFKYSLKIVPIEKVISTSLEEIGNTCLSLSSKIQVDQSFRVLLRKRHTSFSSNDIIVAATSNIEFQVDLSNPDMIVLIEIIGGITGVSVISPDDIFSVVKEKKI